MAQKRGSPDQARTTVQLSRGTKVLLDQLRERCRAQSDRPLSYDDVLYDLLRAELGPAGADMPIAEWRKRDLRELQRQALAVVDELLRTNQRRPEDQVTFNDLIAIDDEVRQRLNTGDTDVVTPAATVANTRSKQVQKLASPRSQRPAPRRRQK